MPTGTIGFGTLASAHEGGTYETIDLTASIGLLVKGTNVLAVEVHQSNKRSSDLVWDCELDYDGFAPWLPSGSLGHVDPIGGVPYDVLRVNGSTGGLGRSVDLADLGSLTIDVDNPPSHTGNANFALFAWFSIPTDADAIDLGAIGTLCFPPIYWVANNLPVGPPGTLSSTPAPWSYTEPSLDGPLDLVLQGVIEENAGGRLRTTNAVLVQVR
jgi:hypothetical protein